MGFNPFSPAGWCMFGCFEQQLGFDLGTPLCTRSRYSTRETAHRCSTWNIGVVSEYTPKKVRQRSAGKFHVEHRRGAPQDPAEGKKFRTLGAWTVLPPDGERYPGRLTLFSARQMTRASLPPFLTSPVPAEHSHPAAIAGLARSHQSVGAPRRSVRHRRKVSPLHIQPSPPDWQSHEPRRCRTTP